MFLSFGKHRRPWMSYVIHFSQLNVTLSSREREIASLRRQLDQSQEELSAVSRDREVALRENAGYRTIWRPWPEENQVHTSTPIDLSLFLGFSSSHPIQNGKKEPNSFHMTIYDQWTSHTHMLTFLWSFLQAVHAEMQEALNKRDELKLRVHSYISEVAR